MNKLPQHFALLGPAPIIEKCSITIVENSEILCRADLQISRLTMQAARQAAILHIMKKF